MASGGGTRIFSDQALAHRLERAEGNACVEFAEARARLSPESGAQWIEVAGAYAIYDGARSPITQTFCLGLFQPATGEDLDAIEAFFGRFGAPVFHEVSPLADKSTAPLLSSRGYRPCEFMNIMSLPLSGRPAIPTSRNPDIVARVTGTDEAELWARTAAEGARDLPEVADLMLDLARISAARLSAVLFLAEIDGRPIAAGALCTHRGVALLAGASTIPEARKQGAQNALLERRLHYAEDSGCDLAMICAEPGSSSQRNAERHGFRIAYTRIKWHLHQYHCG